MKDVKSKYENLENKRSIYFQIGVIFALAIVLLAFEWKTKDRGGIDMNINRSYVIDEDMAEVTVQKKKQHEMPKPMIIQQIKVVLNEFRIDDGDVIIDAENRDDVHNVLDLIFEDEPEPETEEVIPFKIVEQMPSFPGGDEAFFKYLGENLKYPKLASDARISGVVFIQFIVNAGGDVMSVQIERGIGGGCDEEALRVIKNMPHWIPGRQRSKPVPVQLILPVQFKLIP